MGRARAGWASCSCRYARRPTWLALPAENEISGSLATPDIVGRNEEKESWKGGETTLRAFADRCNIIATLKKERIPRHIVCRCAGGRRWAVPGQSPFPYSYKGPPLVRAVDIRALGLPRVQKFGRYFKYLKQKQKQRRRRISSSSLRPALDPLRHCIAGTTPPSALRRLKLPMGTANHYMVGNKI